MTTRPARPRSRLQREGPPGPVGLAGLADLSAGAAFTAGLNLPATAGKVSAVLATYNRCPFDPAAGRLGDNPLTWALDTLLAQAGPALAEIVVVDDGSTDHTRSVLDRYATGTPRPVVPVRLDQHRGAAAARNTAAAAARADWLLFGDDDCLYPPHYAAGAAYLMHTLQQRDPAAAAVMLPFYYRALRPRQALPAEGIGHLDVHRAVYGTRFHTLPAEYLPHLPRFDARSSLLAPLPVRLIGGTALIDKNWLRRAGGFADLAAWSSSYSDHLHLSADLTDAGGRLYHCPDPRLGAAHLKWGATGRYPLDETDLRTLIPGLSRQLGELVAASRIPRTHTGCRVSDMEFPAHMVGAFFAFFAGRSLAGGAAWALRMWREFVEDGQMHSLAVAEVGDRNARQAAWRDGLERGARFLVDGARPGRDRSEVTGMLAQIRAATGTDQLNPWPK